MDPTATLQTPDGIEIINLTTTEAADSCQGATTITVPGGGSTTVNTFTTTGADPDLSCAWGTPVNAKGYRTAWYQFTAANHGVITIDTLGSSYDTVLTVYDGTNGSCTSNANTMTLVTCNDDNNGFSSHVQFTANKGNTYYIQVADWQLGASGNATLQLSLEVEDIDSSWEQMGAMSEARSRHATVVVGNNIFVIGGQTSEFDPFGDNNPQIISSFDRYHVNSQTWANTNTFPELPEADGLSNTTAAYVNTNAGSCNDGCIFVPGGYSGGSTDFNGTHWGFDFDTNLWIEKASIGDSGNPGWPGGAPFAWSTAVTPPDNLGYYLIGGLSSIPAITDTTATIHNNVYFYRVSTNQWEEKTSMDFAKYGHTAAYVGNEICVIGGIETGGILSPNGQCWNPNGTDGWRNIAALSEARYGAGSSVGPDGKWYVYGGANGSSQAIATVEVWDPNNEAAGWVTLDVSRDLGVTNALPPRIWPRGGFVGNYLWAVGGNDSLTTNNRVSITEMQRLFIGQNNLLLPFLINAGTNGDDHFGEAVTIAFNKTYSRDFDEILDLYDVYTFNLNTTTALIVKLREIPGNSDYNIYIYDDNKRLWGKGENPSNQNETVSLTLASGTYYVVVERAFPAGLPNSKNYELRVEK